MVYDIHGHATSRWPNHPWVPHTNQPALPPHDIRCGSPCVSISLDIPFSNDILSVIETLAAIDARVEAPKKMFVGKSLAAVLALAGAQRATAWRNILQDITDVGDATCKVSPDLAAECVRLRLDAAMFLHVSFLSRPGAC